MPPVIAHVLHRLYLAGAEVLAADLARRLGAPGGPYRFVFLCLDEIGPLGRQLAGEGFPVIDLQRRPGVDLGVARRLRAAVREHHIDLLHAHQYTPFFYAAMSRLPPASWTFRGPKILFTEHGRHYPDFRRPKRVFANRLLIRRSDRLTAVGGWVKQCLIDNEGMPAARIEVVYNGIDPDKFTPRAAAAARPAVRAELGIAPDQPVALQVARFHSVKDHATAIRAWAQVIRSWPPPDPPDAGTPPPLFLLVGDGDDRSKIEALAAELSITPHVRFLGARSDVARLIGAADVFLLSSLSEGISVTLLEAMGAGLPIATTAVGGNPEVVAANVTGLLSPRGDAAQLAASLLTLLRDPALRARFGAAARERLLAQFTQQRMHQRYAEIYEEML